MDINELRVGRDYAKIAGPPADGAVAVTRVRLMELTQLMDGWVGWVMAVDCATGIEPAQGWDCGLFQVLVEDLVCEWRVFSDGSKLQPPTCTRAEFHTAYEAGTLPASAWEAIA